MKKSFFKQTQRIDTGELVWREETSKWNESFVWISLVLPENQLREERESLWRVAPAPIPMWKCECSIYLESWFCVRIRNFLFFFVCFESTTSNEFYDDRPRHRHTWHRRSLFLSAIKGRLFRFIQQGSWSLFVHNHPTAFAQQCQITSWCFRIPSLLSISIIQRKTCVIQR